MNLVDLVIAIVVVLAALHGYRLGAIIQICTYGGFWGGLYLGATVAAHLASGTHVASTRTLIALATMTGVATVFGVLGRIVGGILSARLRRGPIGGLDGALGSVAAVVASLLVVWVVANALTATSSTRLNATVAHSRIVRSLDGILPAPPTVFSAVESFLSSEGFPQAFAQLAPTSGPVAVTGGAEVDQVARRFGDGCGDIQEGSGFVVAPDLVVTNAHVVAGISRPTVEDRFGLLDTTVVLFDPRFDLAVLRVPGLDLPSLPLDPEDVDRGTGAVILGYPGGGPFTAGGAGVMDLFQAEGRDIYDQGLTVRPVYEVQGVVRPGNSGGPLIESDGTVIGVIFSRSTTNDDVGYALASPGVLSRVDAARHDTAPVGTGACIDD